MNSFAERFSSTGTAVDIRRAKQLANEDEDISDVMWGTQAGFGNIAKGVHKFQIPSVPDVCLPPFILDAECVLMMFSVFSPQHF